MTILLTGVAGFVGYHVTQALLARGEEVVGVDNLNTYYDVRLKEARLARLEGQSGFRFVRADISDRAAMQAVVDSAPGIDRVVHLAAQAGVRYSIEAPFEYASSNLIGHLVILELCRHLKGLKHLVYASSSSVYGANSALPFSEADRVDTPQSLYAATKRADELMSYAYGHLYAFPQTGLRFFTVYGPWGRPDMAYFSFARAIMASEAITVYDEGRLKRDFTYIDDIVAGVIGALDHPPGGAPPVRLLNIGNNQSETVSHLIETLESALGRQAKIRYAARPAADVVETFADVTAIGDLTGFSPKTKLAVGIAKFAEWFLIWNR